jgi:porphobilinogen synthase
MNNPFDFELSLSFPINRPRRMRASRSIRNAVARTRLGLDDLIAPIFIDGNINGVMEIESMPGVYRYSIDKGIRKVSDYLEQGLDKILIFGIPRYKDEVGSEAYDRDGVVQRFIRELRGTLGDRILIFTDVCMCQYTSHGHCGVISYVDDKYKIQNDKSIELMGRIALSHAEAGADFVAPSSMMDGVVYAIRRKLDEEGYVDVGIMSYSVKYASNFYAPFREAAESSPEFGDRRSYQMDPRISEEAIKEALMDIQEGADILMVKPALAYLDIIKIIRSSFGYFPLAAYNVSGEYSMVKAASKLNWIDEKKVIIEILFSIKRAGADLIITYHAPEIAQWIKEDHELFQW